MKIEKEVLTKENLKKIQAIDDSFYANDITGIDWYLERYNEDHYAYFLKDDLSNVVGYILFVPIKKELYDAITGGVLLNDVHINPNMFIKKSKYHYLFSAIINSQYRHKGYGKRLMETVLKDIDGDICCIAVSKEGYNLANKYMKLKETLNDSVSIFVKKNNCF